MPVVRRERWVLQGMDLGVERGQVPLVADDGQEIKGMDGKAKMVERTTLRLIDQRPVPVDGCLVFRTFEFNLEDEGREELVTLLTGGVVLAKDMPDQPAPQDS